MLHLQCVLSLLTYTTFYLSISMHRIMSIWGIYLDRTLLQWSSNLIIHGLITSASPCRISMNTHQTVNRQWARKQSSYTSNSHNYNLTNFRSFSAKNPSKRSAFRLSFINGLSLYLVHQCIRHIKMRTHVL